MAHPATHSRPHPRPALPRRRRAIRFANQADAFYAVEPADFARQTALLYHAGYRAITLEQFRRFHAGDAVHLPDHPILITFDDGRADAPLHADAILARYGYSAVMYGPGEREVGPFYAYRDALHGETLDGWHERVVADLEWGEQQLRRHVPGYRPLAFAPPFGAYGQLDTNDPAIPDLMGRELRERFGLTFVQQDPHLARPGDAEVTRLQLDRTTTGGDLHNWLETR